MLQALRGDITREPYEWLADPIGFRARELV